MTSEIVERVCTAFAWQRALGNDITRTDLAWLVTNRADPNVWDANHVSQVRARTAAEIENVLASANDALRHCAHRLFVVDPLTPPAFAARLALEDYRELTPTLQLVLSGTLRVTPARVALRPVHSEDDWHCLHGLVQQDHGEGARTHGSVLSDDVTRGIVASYRRKAPAYQFFLAQQDGVDCAYGAGVLCDNGLGMIEDLFTLPALRRRGIASAVIAHAVAHLRAHGAAEVLIGAYTTGAPKRLYAALGFAPVCLTREYIKYERA